VAAVRRATIDANGLRFDALTAGPRGGELVLLLHGFPQSSECWRNALATLGDAGYRTVAFDQRGYSAGANPEGVDAYTVAALSDDVLAVATALGADRFHLAGHDWGGTVAWAVAEREPGRLLSLTAVSTPHTAALAEALRSRSQRTRMAYIPVLRAPRVAEVFIDAVGGALAERALIATGLNPALAHRDIARLRAVGITGPLNWYRAIGRGAPARPRDVSTPTLYIWSDGDPVFTREAAELTADHVTGPYHLVELEGGSHWIPDQHWDDVADLVLAHLRENPGRRRAGPAKAKTASKSPTAKAVSRQRRPKAGPRPAPRKRRVVPGEAATAPAPQPQPEQAATPPSE
jgi:pimeloyl-ACP methyl ester carboxylesterase